MAEADKRERGLKRKGSKVSISGEESEEKVDEDSQVHVPQKPTLMSRGSDSTNSTNSGSTKRRRAQSEVWSLISDGSVPAVHLAPILFCRFCGCEVHTSCKATRAIMHLQRKCVPGRAYIDR